MIVADAYDNARKSDASIPLIVASLTILFPRPNPVKTMRV